MKMINILIITSIFAVFVLISQSNVKSEPYSEFNKPATFCLSEDCYKKICSPQQLDLNQINLFCSLNESKCKCEIYNYDAFYLGLKGKFNPSANMYKSYNDLVNFLEIKNPPILNVNFIEKQMQYYYKGTINVWPNDKYGQYHEAIHFVLRSYTNPQDGFYPYLEEGIAHYGAYCYNNPNSIRCKTGTYNDPNICIPNKDKCKGQIMYTSLVLQLRRDYNCGWNNCFREFLQWAINEKKDKPLNLHDSIIELNKLTGKDTTPLFTYYGIEDKYFQPSFSIFKEDSVIEEEIINENGEFTTLG